MEELPSNFPILLLGTSAVPFVELDEEHSTMFLDNNLYVPVLLNLKNDVFHLEILGALFKISLAQLLLWGNDISTPHHYSSIL